VFTFADTKERFGLAKLVAENNGDILVMSLDSAATLKRHWLPSFSHNLQRALESGM
jgi:hypothetical protein